MHVRIYLHNNTYRTQVAKFRLCMYVCMYVCLHICIVKLLLESGVAFANEFNHLQYDIESLRGVYVHV